MSKFACFSLFASPQSELFEYRAYVLGFYLNCRMNNLLLPDWRTHLDVDKATYETYQALFDWLRDNNNLHLAVHERTPVLCEGMAWRLMSAFTNNVSHIICRDSDSLTSYKEASAIQEYLESGYAFHAINDNPSHASLMGGLVGFATAPLKALTKYQYWEQMILDAAGFDYTQIDTIKEITPWSTVIQCSNLDRRGSDQEFLNSKILPLIKHDLLVHNFEGAGVPEAARTVQFAKVIPPQVPPHLWESNLCSAFIGSAGVNNLETLRFFKRMDPENKKFQEIEKQFPEIFYWRMP